VVVSHCAYRAFNMMLNVGGCTVEGGVGGGGGRQAASLSGVVRRSGGTGLK
jgi:hypothetical protein